jgi:ribosomal protein S18 acetylase RimI-like enzyme
MSVAPALPVERAGVADAEAVVALVNAAYRGDSSRVGWTTEADLLGGQRTDAPAIREIVAAEQCRLLLHRAADGSLLACVLLERTPGGGCYLGMLTVRPDLQAAGLGRRLLAAAERYAAAELGASYVEMTVIGLRTELITWYERRGYARTGGRRPFPYGDERFGVPKRPDLEFEVLRKSLR